MFIQAVHPKCFRNKSLNNVNFHNVCFLGAVTLYESKSKLLMDIICSQINPFKENSTTQKLTRRAGENMNNIYIILNRFLLYI